MNFLFVNKNKRNRDKRICQNYSRNYLKLLIIHNLFNVKNIMIEKKLIYLILVQYQDILKNRYNYKVYHKDISFLSGRTRAIFTKYGISRTDFKKLMIYHQIPNIKKSSW